MKMITQRNANVHSIGFGLVIPKGSVDEPARLGGITHLIEHMCFRKAGERTQKEIYGFSERKGVNIEAATYKDHLSFLFECRTEVFESILLLLRDMLAELDYTEDDLSAEKRVVLSEIEEKDESNGGKIIDDSWANKRYARPILGDADSLNKITLKDAVAYKKRLLDEETTVFLIGNFTDEHISSVDKLFNDPNKSSVAKAARSDKKEDVGGSCGIGNKTVRFMDDEYSEIDIYYTFKLSLPEKDREKYIICTQMINSAFTQGYAAYLKSTLREMHGFIYSVDDWVRNSDGEVIWQFRVQTQEKNIVTVVEYIERLIKDFVFDEEYFSYIKAWFYDNDEIMYDDIRETLDSFIYDHIAFGDKLTHKESVELIVKTPLSEYNEIYKKLTENKKVHFFGNVSGGTKKKLRRMIK